MATAVGKAPRQTPYRRTYPDGRAVWVARYRDPNGRVRYAKPAWNGDKSTFARKGEAQAAIDEALTLLRRPSAPARQTLGAYAENWLTLHPRSQRTNATNAARLGYVLDIEIERRALREWRFDDLRRRHVRTLIDHMLIRQGRAVQGVRGILSVLSTMAEDAIEDEAAEANPFRGIRLRREDPRARKDSRPIRIWSFEQMRAFAAAGRAAVRARTERPPAPAARDRSRRRARCFPARDYEAMLLTPALTGVRLGELLALCSEDFEGDSLLVRGSAHEGALVGSSAQKNHHRRVPVPPSLARLIEARPDPGRELLFPTPTGRLWRERNFYRDVWEPARIASGLDPTPHEFRHSYISQLRAAGIDDADLASVSGHSVETMLSRYTHALQRSHAAIREAIG